MNFSDRNPTPDGAAVRLAAVARSFGPVRAVDGLDLAIRCGETVALLGPNGAGKSTTISMLLGLLPPDGGSVEVFGASPQEAVAAGRIGAMLQEARMLADLTVAELVGFIRHLYPNPLPAAAVLEAAGLTDLARRRVAKLSGGQAQRVRFALALAGNPELLVLDEPTAAMDVESRRAFWASMRTHADTGRTILFSTHYLEEADSHADRVVVISQGRVVADGSPAEIKRMATGRLIRFDLAGAPSQGLAALPGVVSVEIRGDRACLRSSDPDTTLARLFAERRVVRDLEVTGASLEDAFTALTSTDPNPAGTRPVLLEH